MDRIFWEDSLDGPKRKYYKMTQKGEEMLKERLEKYLETHQALLSLSGICYEWTAYH